MRKICLFNFLAFPLFFLLFTPFLSAQQIIVEPMPFLDKLSTNSIFNIYQDKKGFIWIGTAYGLERYDGYNTQSFISNYKTPYKLTSNDIRCFTEDDHFLWIGTTQGINLIDKNTYTTTSFPDSTVQKNEIRDLVCDWEGSVWVATNKGLLKCDAKLGVLKEYPLKSIANSFFEDQKGILWILTSNGEILKYNNHSDSFVEYAYMKSNSPYRMTQDSQGRYWIATWGKGIWRFDPDSVEKEQMFHQQSIINPIRHFPEQVFYDITQDDTYGYIWALSHFRLYIFRINEQSELEEVNINTIKDINQPIDQYKTYSRIIKDNSGNLWLGAYDQSYTITFEKSEILNYTMQDLKQRLGVDTNILYFNKDSKGILWFDQSRYGLCLFNEQTGNITYGNNTNDLYSIVVASIVPSQKEDAVWLGGRNNFSTKIWKMKQERMQISILEEFDLKDVIDSPGSISQLVEDDYGNIWIGTTSHLFFKPANSKQISRIPFDIPHITNMCTDNKGNVWVCSQEGIYQMSYEEKPVLLKHYSKAMMPFCNDPISKISVNNRCVWFSTSLGKLFQLDLKEGVITEQTDICGLEGNNILKILSNDNKLWIVSDKYIVYHNPKQKENITYSVNDDNIFVSSFRHSAAFIDDGGCLYAGGHNGFIKILPHSQHIKNNEAKQVCITDIKSDNRSILFLPMGLEIDNSVHQVTLLPDARNIEIFFSSLSYNSNRKVKYAYKMEGLDDKWTYIENGKHSAFYNQLGKGKYTFRIKVTDLYGNWMKDEQLLGIHRLPAWYETSYAYLLYTLLIISIVYLSFHDYTKRMTRKNKLKLQEELTQIKINYFTNISHELLTPLTIISCVADDLEENEDSTERQVEILRTNTSRLRRLLQQILDFRKIESGKIELNVSKNNLSSFVSEVVTSNFQSLAHKKGIRLTTQIDNGIWGYIDIDKFDKILFNILSNAIKYTSAHKNVNVRIATIDKEAYKYLILEVEDEGIGIEKKDLDKIFTKFYHNKSLHGYESNGIGLSLTKELVTLHRGSIEVCSELGKGSTFTVTIPISKNAYNEQEVIQNSAIDTSAEEVAEITTQHDKKPCILFIDDNEELRELIQRIFNKKYNILVAEDALKGIEMLKNSPVDIIICDIMMPQMNGLEFCQKIKSDMQVNHIPVIMLTAKNTTNDQIECYEAGAESYIAKPFEMKILQARIENLLKKRESSQKNFRARMEVDLSNIDYQSPDEKFLNDAILCVEKHIKDSDFDIEQMSSELHISRSTLTRKCKVIAGCTPWELIRNIRLKYACTLLSKNKLGNISEVAYATGFSSTKYFTKCFKEEFGITPTEFQEK